MASKEPTQFPGPPGSGGYRHVPQPKAPDRPWSEAARERISELERQVERLKDAVDVAREQRDQADSRAKEKVQAEMAALRARVTDLQRGKEFAINTMQNMSVLCTLRGMQHVSIELDKAVESLGKR